MQKNNRSSNSHNSNGRNQKPNPQSRGPSGNSPNTARRVPAVQTRRNDQSDTYFYIVVGLIAAIIISLIVIFSLVTANMADDKTPIVTDPGTSAHSTAKSTDKITTAVTAHVTTHGNPGVTTTPPVTTSAPPVTTSTPADTDPPFPSQNVLAKTPDMGQDYINRITFLGDSTTYGLKAYKMLADGSNTKQVWAPLSGTLAIPECSKANILYPEVGREIYIYEAAGMKKPDILIITLGHNFYSIQTDPAKRKQYFKNEYKKLIDAIKTASPDTKIILQSVFPVAPSIYDKISNDTINERNKWILEIAEESGLKYLDTASALKNAKGELEITYQNGDGCHLNERGFTAELEYIRTHAYTD